MKGHKGKIGCVVSILIACPHGELQWESAPEVIEKTGDATRQLARDRLIGNYVREIQEHPVGQGCPHSHRQRANDGYGVKGKRLRALLEGIILV